MWFTSGSDRTDSAVQPAKTLVPIDRADGSLMSVRFLQLAKALAPTELIPGKSIRDSAEQL